VGVNENEFENIENLDGDTKIQKIEEIIQKSNNPNKMIFNFLLGKIKETNEKLKKQDILIKNLYAQNNNYVEQLQLFDTELKKLNNTINNNII